MRRTCASLNSSNQKQMVTLSFIQRLTNGRCEDDSDLVPFASSSSGNFNHPDRLFKHGLTYSRVDAGVRRPILPNLSLSVKGYREERVTGSSLAQRNASPRLTMGASDRSELLLCQKIDDDRFFSSPRQYGNPLVVVVVVQ